MSLKKERVFVWLLIGAAVLSVVGMALGVGAMLLVLAG